MESLTTDNVTGTHIIVNITCVRVCMFVYVCVCLCVCACGCGVVADSAMVGCTLATVLADAALSQLRYMLDTCEPFDEKNFVACVARRCGVAEDRVCTLRGSCFNIGCCNLSALWVLWVLLPKC